MNRDWKGEEDRFPPRTAKLAVEWLEENYLFSPFFLWIDFFDPHEPWDPPEYMVRKYDPDYDGTPMIHPNYGKASDYTGPELRNLRAHYCAETELVDRWIGRILQKIDDLDLWKNSIVVFTTDHGTSLGEHNRTGKSNINDNDDRHWPIYPEVAHIPFLVSAPDLEGGTVVNTLAQPADIMPTLADLAGVELDPPEPTHGISFAPNLRGKSAEPIREVAITSRFLRRENGNIPPGSVTPVLYTEKWAYVPIGAEGKAELHDIEQDPYAVNDVSGKHPDVVHDLQAKLLDWLKHVDAPPEAIQAVRVTEGSE
jgi:arylsulfatase A-like enzyme